MDLVEDFDRVRNFVDLGGGGGERYGAGEAGDEGGRAGGGALEDAPPTSTSYDLPSLTLELSLRQAARLVCALLVWGLVRR